MGEEVIWVMGAIGMALAGQGHGLPSLPKIASFQLFGWCTHNFSWFDLYISQKQSESEARGRMFYHLNEGSHLWRKENKLKKE